MTINQQPPSAQGPCPSTREEATEGGPYTRPTSPGQSCRLSWRVRRTDWAEFRRVFKEMADDNYSPAIYLKQLTQKLPKEGRDLLSQITLMEEAWDILGHHYSNMEMIIATVIQ